MNKDIDDNEQLLPWLVNGTLEGEEKARVEAWLAEQEDGDELRGFDEALRAQVRAEQVGSPGAFGLRRLQQEIQAERKTAQPTRAANDNRWWRPAIAAAALVIMVQGGVIFDQFRDQGEYTPLGVEQAGVVLQVEFNPTPPSSRSVNCCWASTLKSSAVPGLPGSTGYSLPMEMRRRMTPWPRCGPRRTWCVTPSRSDAMTSPRLWGVVLLSLVALPAAGQSSTTNGGTPTGFVIIPAEPEGPDSFTSNPPSPPPPGPDSLVSNPKPKKPDSTDPRPVAPETRKPEPAAPEKRTPVESDNPPARSTAGDGSPDATQGTDSAGPVADTRSQNRASLVRRLDQGIGLRTDAGDWTGISAGR